MNVRALLGIISNVQPKQIDIAHVPVVSLQCLAKWNLWLVNLKNSSLDVGYNC